MQPPTHRNSDERHYLKVRPLGDRSISGSPLTEGGGWRRRPARSAGHRQRFEEPVDVGRADGELHWPRFLSVRVIALLAMVAIIIALVATR